MIHVISMVSIKSETEGEGQKERDRRKGTEGEQQREKEKDGGRGTDGENKERCVLYLRTMRGQYIVCRTLYCIQCTGYMITLTLNVALWTLEPHTVS